MWKNVEILWFVHVFVYYWIIAYAQSSNVSEKDICDGVKGRKVFLELGENGALISRNLKFPYSFHQNSTHNTCFIEFVTCPSCVVEVSFRFMNISTDCGRISLPNSCSCDYVWIHEPQYEKASGEPFCGRYIHNNKSELNYKSLTRNLRITFFYSMNYEHAFTINFTSKRNSYLVDGHPYIDNRINNSSNQWISSPFFPSYYPTDLISEHVIKCKSPLDKCRISLSFNDYRIGKDSILEFFDSNGFRMYVSTGNIFRPATLTSTGSSMTIRFYANGYTNMGYRASYSFLLESTDYIEPNLECGGWVNNLGGAITMMNMTSNGKFEAYDCIYIVKPPLKYSHLKTHLCLKVVTFSDFAGNTELTLRQGSTSKDSLLEVLRHPATQFVSSQKEYVAPISVGFYLSLKGLFKSSSSLTIVYTTFSYKDCFSGLDFLCRNLRCIPAFLTCDGFDHCGDNSDEAEDCSKGLKNHRSSQIPNFFFPNVNNYSDLTTATFIFLSCSFGFVGLIFGMAIYFYRGNFYANQNNRIPIQDHSETINAILAEAIISDIEEEVVESDNPPLYEPPPNYNDVVKNIKKSMLNHEAATEKNEKRSCSRCNSTCSRRSSRKFSNMRNNSIQSIPRVFSAIPASPPPVYASVDPMEGSRKNSMHTSDVSLPTTSEEPTELIVTRRIHQCLHFRDKTIKKSLSDSLLLEKVISYLKRSKGRTNSLKIIRRSHSCDNFVLLSK